MAKTNKYASINFNHFYEKTPSTHPNHTANNNNKPTKNSSSSSSSSSSSYSAISSPKTHGRMLVLTRPTPTPRPTTTTTTPPPKSPSPQPQPQRSHQIPGQTPSESGSDHISLRPLGHTGTSSPVPSLEKEKQAVSPAALSPKLGKFVPPHLRPGFVGKEERPVPEVGRGRDSGRNNFESPVRYGEDGRPQSGGGYDRRKREGESDLGMVSRPRSSGNLPSSSG